jgi:integrase
VKRPKESEGRGRFFEPAEEPALMAELREPHRTLVLVGIHAGLRVRAEALSLTWPNVDLRRNLVSVQAAFAKTGKTRSVTINSVLRGALVGLKEAARSECVFTRRDGEPLRALRTLFMKACAKAKLEDMTPHVLRHTFASRLAMAGVDLHTIQELGGWRSLKTVEGYAHLSPSHRAEAVERLASNFPMLFTTPTIGAVAPAAQVR